MKDIEQRKAELQQKAALDTSGTYDLRAFGNKECAEKALIIIDQQDAENQSLKEEVEGINKLYQGVLSFLVAKEEEIERLKEELEERKAYIVANPCAQCGGKINAEKCGAWTKRSNEFERKLEIAVKALEIYANRKLTFNGNPMPNGGEYAQEALNQLKELNDK